MLKILLWVMPFILHPPEQREMTERLVPAEYQGNYWGPQALQLKREGKLPPIRLTSHMARWDEWGRKVLRNGDILFRLGDARLLGGYFPMSRFYANASNSKFSHTGIVAIEDEGPVVYDTVGTGVARQPFSVWILDNVGNFGVKRLRAPYQDRIPKVLSFCREVFRKQVPFDYELGLDDSAFYCVEMTEKAFRSADLPLSEPVRLGDMERAREFPLCMFGIQLLSRYLLEHPLTFETPAFFPGNERHGIWSSPLLEVVVPPTFKPGCPLMPDHGLPVVADRKK
jgi:hypothetical protein